MGEAKDWIQEPFLARLRSNGDIWFNIHGYSHVTAMRLIEDVMRVAYARGAPALVIFHGAAEITSRGVMEQRRGDRGSIKIEFREQLKNGTYSAWAYKRSRYNQLDPGAGQSRIVLKPNDAPEEVAWPDCPERDYL